MKNYKIDNSIKMIDRNLIFYDFECFSKAKMENNKSWWMAVFIEYPSMNKTVIIFDEDELEKYYSKNINSIFIGYNSRNYDQWLLKGIISGLDAGYINDGLIEKRMSGYKLVPKHKNIPLIGFDVSDGGVHSLKQFEAFMGSMIKESDVDFNLDRPLTDKEIEETIFYCTHDVEETIKVWIERSKKKDDFSAQVLLIDMYNLDPLLFNKTQAQLSAEILGGIKQHSIDDEFDIEVPNTLELKKYNYVKDWYLNPRNKTYERSLTTNVWGTEAKFAYGGVHSAIPNYHNNDGYLWCADVALI